MAWSPLAFRAPQVSIWLVLVYLAIITPLLVLHLTVPKAPSNPTPASGLNLTEAWLDLKELSNGFHPYNSRRNDQVHDFLLAKVELILKRNDASYSIDNGTDLAALKTKDVVVYNDLISNATFSRNELSVYFEGTNIIVHVRGTEATTSDVLVNAHYDSVSTGYGATDDGMGVISMLQLISHFTTDGSKPKRSITFLFNNGEEDFLNGARAFMLHPLASKAHIFLNLEGAGAGGKAILFRSTDTEVTKFYRSAPYPSGTVVTADGFKGGLVKSETDYAIFNGLYGMRGLDVAFYEPRSRYHTIEDSTKYDSVDSLWNMLSNALAAVEAMSSDTSSTFDGDSSPDKQVQAGNGTPGVWFDLFSRTFAVLRLHTLFAVSVTLLVVTPLVLAAIQLLLVRFGKWYPFSARMRLDHEDSHHIVKLDGLKGFFRVPVAFVLSTGAVIGLAFLQTKVNPFIIYSSEYAVWSMFLSAWLVFDWFIMYGAYQMRPSALTRFYAILWTYSISWLLLAANTVLENNFTLSGGYFLVIFLGTTFCALLISYLELFALPMKEQYAQDYVYPPDTDEEPGESPPDDEDNEPSERTSLLRGDRQTFSRGYGGQTRSSTGGNGGGEPASIEGQLRKLTGLDDEEQGWSANMPTWTWIIQLILLVPINVILVGEIGLYITSALHNTPADGTPVLFIYLVIAVLTIFILSPLRPFLHKLSPYVPVFLVLVLAGTLSYNLTAFPFSGNAKLHIKFAQRVDLDTGINTVSLFGLAGYIQSVVKELPSAAAQPLNCSAFDTANRQGITQCDWTGLPPNVVKDANPWLPPGVLPQPGYKDWLNYTLKEVENTTASAVFEITARGSKACKILFDQPVTAFNITGGGTDKHGPPIGPNGASEIRLWHRDWDKKWEVTVKWNETSTEAKKSKKDKALGVTGRVACMWSDANTPGVIPALDEVWRFMPLWAMVAKMADGLVEGSKTFEF